MMDGAMKIPDPIIDPTMIVVAENAPRLRSSFAGSAMWTHHTRALLLFLTFRLFRFSTILGLRHGPPPARAQECRYCRRRRRGARRAAQTDAGADRPDRARDRRD